MRRRKGMTRRDFLQGTARIALAGAASGAALAQGTAGPAPAAADQSASRAKVILVRDANAVDAGGNVNAEVLQRMLDDAVAALMGEKEPVAAWEKVVKPDDIVGIKSNVAGPPRTPPELEAAIKRRVIDAGIAEDRVSVDDRGVLKNPVFQKATALVNARPMRAHDWAGVGSLLKNYLMFSDSPSSWHPDSCADLAGLWDLPMVRGKTRLNILVMLVPLFHGKGPHSYQKEYTWNYNGLVVGVDPVACDATGLRIMEAKRLAHFGEVQPFPVSPKHIQVAQDKFHLGVADANRIDVQKIGWERDVLI